MTKKTVQIALISLISIIILFLLYTYFKNDKNFNNDYNNENSMIVSSEYSSSEVKEELPDSFEDINANHQEEIKHNKAILPELNLFQLSNLSTNQVDWGPGTRYDEENRNIDCIAFQEEYEEYGAQFIMDDDKIYLTFDLGYEPGYTNDILDTLKEKNVNATFFITSTYIKGNEEIVQRMIDEGHSIGGHSITHPNMTRVSNEQAIKEFNGLNNLLLEQFNVSSNLFRFPEGAFSEKALAIASNEGYYTIFWSFAYHDWDNNNQPSYSTALEKATNRLHSGAIYLLHPMKTNSEILPALIDYATEKGYEFGIF